MQLYLADVSVFCGVVSGILLMYDVSVVCGISFMYLFLWCCLWYLGHAFVFVVLLLVFGQCICFCSVVCGMWVLYLCDI